MPDTIICNLHNLETNRYHPILFRLYPWTGDGKLRRYKSLGHHTDGFDTRAASVAFCEQEAVKREASLCVEKDFPWDGHELPAMVIFFGEIDGKLRPVVGG